MRKRSSPAAPYLFSILTLLAAFMITACRPPEAKPSSSSSLAVAVRLDGAPTVGAVPVVVELTGPAGPVTGATVKVTGDMTHAGMQPVLTTAAEVGEGTYRAGDFEFSMAGDWIITVDVTTASGARARGELFTTVASR